MNWFKKSIIRDVAFAATLGLMGVGFVWHIFIFYGEMRRRVKTELQVEGLIHGINQLSDAFSQLHKQHEDYRKLLELYGIATITK